MANVNLVGPGIKADDLGDGVTLLALTESAQGKVDFIDGLSFEEKIRVWEALYPPKEGRDG